MIDRGRQDLAERARRTDLVLAQLRDRPFSWKTRGNCIHLLRAQLVTFGHSVPPVKGFTTALGAKRALHATGHRTLESLVTAYLPRIPPSRLIVGDVVMVPGIAPFNALAVFAGNRSVLGWHGKDLSRMVSYEVSAHEILAAWAVELIA